MDIIEELHLEDILLIDKYFSNELSVEEKKVFKKRLKKDKKLQEDYLMIQKTYYSNNEKSISERRSSNEILQQLEFQRRNITGKELIKYGLWIALFMGMLLVFSAFLMLLFF